MEHIVLFGTDNSIFFQDDQSIVDPQLILDCLEAGTLHVKKYETTDIELNVPEGSKFTHYNSVEYRLE